MTEYVPVPVETSLEELSIKGENESPPSCWVNSPLSSGTLNLSPGSPPLKGRIDSPLPVGWKIPIVPTDPEPVRSISEDVANLGNPQVSAWLYPVIVPDAKQSTIPGVGEDCGLIDRISKRVVSCSRDSSHDNYEVEGTSCGKPDCPRHWRTWARRGADRVGKRLWGYKEASKGRRNPRHTVFSIDDEDPLVLSRSSQSDESNLKYFRRYFIKKAISLSVSDNPGGSMVIHLWRTNDKVPKRIADDRRWDWVRKQGAAWRRYVRFSPHAHVIGYGYYQEPEKGDFSYKNFKPLADRDAVESVAYYQLQHAPVGIGNAVVYWGCCQPGCMKVISQGVTHAPAFCIKCGAPMIYEDNGDDYCRKRSWAIYELRDKSIRKTKVSVRAAIWGDVLPPGLCS